MLTLMYKIIIYGSFSAKGRLGHIFFSLSMNINLVQVDGVNGQINIYNGWPERNKMKCKLLTLWL